MTGTIESEPPRQVQQLIEEAALERFLLTSATPNNVARRWKRSVSLANYEAILNNTAYNVLGTIHSSDPDFPFFKCNREKRKGSSCYCYNDEFRAKRGKKVEMIMKRNAKYNWQVIRQGSMIKTTSCLCLSFFRKEKADLIWREWYV